MQTILYINILSKFQWHLEALRKLTGSIANMHAHLHNISQCAVHMDSHSSEAGSLIFFY